MATAKKSVQETLDHLSDQASWDEIMYELYVKQKIEKGLLAGKNGNTLEHEKAKRRLLGDEN